MYAYINFGFLHNDLHLDNVLFKKTKLEVIKYKDIEIKTNNYKIVIMDYDSSFINVNIDDGVEYYWNNLGNLFSRIDYDLNKYIIAINNIAITTFINNARSNKYNPNRTIELLRLIDNLEFKLPIPLQSLTYNLFVF